jgi:uncharacterized repeat protein (TIGR01451 family)
MIEHQIQLSAVWSGCLRGILVGALSAVILPAAYATDPANTIVVKNMGETEVSVTSPGGTVETRRVPVEKAAPGAVVIYTTTFRNQGAKAASDIAITNPIPAHTAYVRGSAFGDNTVITYSIDGGKTFAAPEKLVVKAADGAQRPALPTEYTHVHWLYKGALAPEQVGSVGFRVLVN